MVLLTGKLSGGPERVALKVLGRTSSTLVGRTHSSTDPPADALRSPLRIARSIRGATAAGRARWRYWRSGCGRMQVWTLANGLGGIVEAAQD